MSQETVQVLSAITKMIFALTTLISALTAPYVATCRLVDRYYAFKTKNPPRTL